MFQFQYRIVSSLFVSVLVFLLLGPAIVPLLTFQSFKAIGAYPWALWIGWPLGLVGGIIFSQFHFISSRVFCQIMNSRSSWVMMGAFAGMATGLMLTIWLVVFHGWKVDTSEDFLRLILGITVGPAILCGVFIAILFKRPERPLSQMPKLDMLLVWAKGSIPKKIAAISIIITMLIAPIAFYEFAVGLPKVLFPEKYEKNSLWTPKGKERFSSESKQILLRPSNITIHVPQNHIRSISRNRITLGYPMDQDVAGKMKETVHLAFLLPDFQPRSIENDHILGRHSTSKEVGAIDITIGYSTGRDFLPITTWKTIRKCGPIRTMPELIKKHPKIGLDEYRRENWPDVWYLNDEILIRFRSDPNSYPNISAEIGYVLENHISVRYTYPARYLPMWEKIDLFVRQAIMSYGLPQPTLSIPTGTKCENSKGND